MAANLVNEDKLKDFSTKSEGTVNSNEMSKSQYNCTVCLVLILVKLNLVIAALVTLVGYYFYEDTYYNLPAFKNGQLEDLSVYCDDLSLGPDDDDETFNTQKNDFKLSVNDDGRYVCTYDSNTMSRGISKVVERRSRIRSIKGLDGRQYLSCGRESLAPKSGYLTVTFSNISGHQIFKDNAVDILLHWDKHPERSYVDQNIHYHNGEIVIPEGRAYFIYASVHFRISKKKNNFSLRICRNKHGYEETLLSKSQLFNMSEDNSLSSLNVGSYLQMSKNDKIYVKVSNANAVVRESRGNTFGIFPL